MQGHLRIGNSFIPLGFFKGNEGDDPDFGACQTCGDPDELDHDGLCAICADAVSASEGDDE